MDKEAESLEVARTVAFETEAVLPALVLLIALASLAKVTHYAHSKANWLEMLPMMLTQLITIFIWTCMGLKQCFDEI